MYMSTLCNTHLVYVDIATSEFSHVAGITQNLLFHIAPYKALFLWQTIFFEPDSTSLEVSSCTLDLGLFMGDSSNMLTSKRLLHYSQQLV